MDHNPVETWLDVIEDCHDPSTLAMDVSVDHNPVETWLDVIAKQAMEMAEAGSKKQKRNAFDISNACLCKTFT